MQQSGVGAPLLCALNCVVWGVYAAAAAAAAAAGVAAAARCRWQIIQSPLGPLTL